MAPLATRLITQTAYHGWEPRQWLQRGVVIAAGPRVVDLGCGVGTSTVSTGVDSSREMIRVARWLKSSGQRFEVGDAEDWGDDDSFDAATISFVLHEAPADGRARILSNALRIAPNLLCIIDICPTYRPSRTMLAGEPFLEEYLENVDSDVARVTRAGGCVWSRRSVLSNHVVLWSIARDAATLRRLDHALQHPPLR